MDKENVQPQSMSTIKFLFIMDPIENIIPLKDTTYILMLEAESRGHEIYYALQNDLTIKDNKANIKKLSKVEMIIPERVGTNNNVCKILENINNVDLDYFDVIFMRKDPPVDDDYIKSTYLLDMVKDQVLVVNDPTALRSYNEKLSTLRFENIIPNSIVCKGDDLDTIKDWASSFKSGIVIKPLNLCGGQGVIKFNGQNISTLKLNPDENYILQEFIDKVIEGDKRIIILNGAPIGAILRMPKDGDFICNFHSGGTPHKTNINSQDLLICSEIKNFLIDNNIYLAGIDVVGGLLTEINITSPTCIQEINRANGTKLEKNVLDFIIHKVDKG